MPIIPFIIANRQTQSETTAGQVAYPCLEYLVGLKTYHSFIQNKVLEAPARCQALFWALKIHNPYPYEAHSLVGETEQSKITQG